MIGLSKDQRAEYMRRIVDMSEAAGLRPTFEYNEKGIPEYLQQPNYAVLSFDQNKSIK